jgi:hypothetical protein
MNKKEKVVYNYNNTILKERGISNMPRGVKKTINYNEEIPKIEMQINRHLKTIKELKNKKSEFIKAQEFEQVKQLNNFLQSNNISAQSLLGLLNQN